MKNRSLLANLLVLVPIFCIGFAPPLQAAILFTDIDDLVLSGIRNTLYFDVDRSGSAPYASIGTGFGADFSVEFTSAETLRVLSTTTDWNFATSPAHYNQKLAFGTTLDSFDEYTPTNGSFFEINDPNLPFTGNWDGGGEGFLGAYRTVGADRFYIYAHFNYDDLNDRITLLDFAYEMRPNVGIVMGAVPEPSTIMLFVLGVGGWITFRHLRRGLNPGHYGPKSQVAGSLVC